MDTSRDKPEPAHCRRESQHASKLRVKRPFKWTAGKSYKKGDVFDLSRCSRAQLERVAVMRDSGGFFEPCQRRATESDEYYRS